MNTIKGLAGLKSINLDHQNKLNKEQKDLELAQNLRFTSPTTRKLLPHARDTDDTINKTITEEKSQSDSSRWIMKSQIKEACDSKIKGSLPINNDEIKRIQAYTKAQQYKFNQALHLNNEKIRQIYCLFQKYRNRSNENKRLKKKIVLKDLQRKRSQWLINYHQKLQNQIQQYSKQYKLLQSQILRNYQELEILCQEIKKFTQQISFVKSQIANLESQIEQKKLERKEKQRLINQLILQRMPNQANMTQCMFLIGILIEQLYILQLEKTCKKQVEIRQNKSTNREEESDKKLLLNKVSQAQSKRYVIIDCKNSNIVPFKIMTLIYMHCRSLCVNNLISLMRKTAYFCKQFLYKYQGQRFEQYFSRIIDQNKESYKKNPEDIKNLGLKKETLFLIVITEQKSIQYMLWILQTFQLQGQNFIVEFNQFIVAIKLVCLQDFQTEVKIQADDNRPNLLRIQLQN